jgi:hypothetical protein
MDAGNWGVTRRQITNQGVNQVADSRNHHAIAGQGPDPFILVKKEDQIGDCDEDVGIKSKLEK